MRIALPATSRILPYIPTGSPDQLDQFTEIPSQIAFTIDPRSPIVPVSAGANIYNESFATYSEVDVNNQIAGNAPLGVLQPGLWELSAQFRGSAHNGTGQMVIGFSIEPGAGVAAFLIGQLLYADGTTRELNFSYAQRLAFSVAMTLVFSWTVAGLSDTIKGMACLTAEKIL